jgi:hypothetical protein
MGLLMIEFTDADHFTEKWTNTEAGKDSIFEMHFHREPVRDLLRGSHRSMLASPLPCGFATNRLRGRS